MFALNYRSSKLTKYACAPLVPVKMSVCPLAYLYATTIVGMLSRLKVHARALQLKEARPSQQVCLCLQC